MIYIEKNAQGEIQNIEFSPGPNREEISLHDPKLRDFIENAPNSDELIEQVLNRLDLDMVRTIEDLIDMMIEKDLMRFTDLPKPVQNKILFKKNIRNLSKKEASIISDDELLNL